MKKALNIALTALALITVLILQAWMPGKAKRELYQMTVYHFTSAAQEKVLDNYLQNALLPALHKMNIKNVGVFKNHANDTIIDKTMYVLAAIQSAEEVMKINAKLTGDYIYQTAAAEYLNAVYTTPPYSR